MMHMYNPNYNGLYHAEVQVNSGYTGKGQTRFYGFWLRLSES